MNPYTDEEQAHAALLAGSGPPSLTNYDSSSLPVARDTDPNHLLPLLLMGAGSLGAGALGGAAMAGAGEANFLRAIVLRGMLEQARMAAPEGGALPTEAEALRRAAWMLHHAKRLASSAGTYGTGLYRTAAQSFNQIASNLP